MVAVASQQQPATLLALKLDMQMQTPLVTHARQEGVDKTVAKLAASSGIFMYHWQYSTIHICIVIYMSY